MKTIYVVLTNYYPNNYFGAYSDIRDARHAIELLGGNTDIFKSVKDYGDYRYILTTHDDKEYWAEIWADTINIY